MMDLHSYNDENMYSRLDAKQMSPLSKFKEREVNNKSISNPMHLSGNCPDSSVRAKRMKFGLSSHFSASNMTNNQNDDKNQRLTQMTMRFGTQISSYGDQAQPGTQKRRASNEGDKDENAFHFELNTKQKKQTEAVNINQTVYQNVSQNEITNT